MDSPSRRKRKEDPIDDFFALSAPKDKKKKKKRPKLKKDDTVSTILESVIDIEDEIDEPAATSSDKVEPKNSSPTPEVISDDEPALIEEEDELFEFLKETSASIERHENNSYNFSESSERRRSYIVRIVSKLDATTPISLDIGTKGLKKFEKIHEAALREAKKRAGNPGMKHYTVLNTSLAWIEGRQEIKPFFKPSTLRIQPPPEYIGSNLAKFPLTHISCLLYPKAQNYLDYPELESSSSWRKLSQLSSELSTMDEPVVSADETSDEELLDEIQKSIQQQLTDIDYFEIGLKGKDNKRVSVQVSHNTKIGDLLRHYANSKGIEITPEAKLIFDDEELDLDGIVGDTELEDEFEVQVIV